MKIKSIKFLTVMIFLPVSLLFSQSYAPEMPVVIPPSADVAALMRYVDIPVNHSTGVPQIDIPIYEIKAGDVSLPISISYHASGNKIDDVASIIGLGWTINAGGAISRQILGQRDENFDYFRTVGFNNSSELYNQIQASRQDMQKEIGLIELIEGAKKYYDSHSDRYSYSVNNLSGIFRYKFESGNKQKTICPIPYSPIKIDRPSSDNFIITDTKGNRYFFEEPEHNFTNGVIGSSSWLLTQIITVDGKYNIRLHYSDKDQYYSHTFGVNCTFGEFWQIWRDDNEEGSCNFQRRNATPDKGEYDVSCTTVNYEPRLLTKIELNGETVVDLFYTSDRKDIRNKRLSSLKIYQNDVIKEFQFYHNYSGRSDVRTWQGSTKDIGLRMMLDKIEVKDTKGVIVERYGFSYNSITLPPYYFPQDYNYPYGDFWGYHNGNGGGRIHTTGALLNSYKGNRIPNEDYMKACILEGITYPTGGSAKFEYEAIASGVQDKAKVGGLQIKRITNYSNPSVVAKIREYEYIAGMSADFIPSRESFSYDHIRRTNLLDSFHYTCSEDYRDGQLTTLTSSSIVDQTMGTGLQAINIKVTETVQDSLGLISAISEFIYQDIDHSYFERYQPPFIGKTPYFYDIGSYSPKMLNAYYYEIKDNNQVLVKEENNTYTKILKGEFTTGLQTYCQLSFTPDLLYLYNRGIVPPHCLSHYTSAYLNNLVYEDCKALQDVILLSEKEIIEYNPRGEFKTLEKYDYDDKTLLIRSVKRTSSDNSEIKEFFTYPVDYQDDLMYTKMTLGNMLDYLVSKEMYKDNSFLQRMTVSFKEWHNNMFAPQKYQWQTFLQGEVQDRITYHNYDKYGNPLYITKDDVTKIVYLWGYKNQYPIAEIKNISFDEVKTALGGETEIQRISNTAFLSTSDSLKINNLRSNILLKDALITTFVYKPLVGMLKSTNPNGISTFYSYDDYGRLEEIKDNDQNSISRYEYNYTKYAPFECNLNSVREIYVQSHPISFSSNIKNGSGNFSIDWSIEDRNQNIIASKKNDLNNKFDLTLNLIGNFILTCKITDMSDNKIVVIRKDIQVNPSLSSLTIKPEQLEYNTGESVIFEVLIHGGSNNYSYKWTLADSNGNILKSQTGGQVFKTIFTKNDGSPYKGNVIVSTEIRDNLTGHVKNVSKTINIKAFMELKMLPLINKYKIGNCIFNVIAEYAPSNLIYNWRLQNQEGAILKTQSGSSSSFSSHFNNSNKGQMFLYCEVTDFSTNISKGITKTFDVCEEVNFNSGFHSGHGEYSEESYITSISVSSDSYIHFALHKEYGTDLDIIVDGKSIDPAYVSGEEDDTDVYLMIPFIGQNLHRSIQLRIMSESGYASLEIIDSCYNEDSCSCNKQISNSVIIGDNNYIYVSK